MPVLVRKLFLLVIVLAISAFAATLSFAQPRIIIISLDGATPSLVREFMLDGTISPSRGLGLLANKGATALRNTTANPSLTAPGHIAIATGSTAARNDIPANTFHLVGSSFPLNISGFGAPIGGYDFRHSGESADPTAEPLWLALRAAGKRVVTATFPGGDGVDVRLPVPVGTGPIIQSSGKRTVDFTVPFGAFGGVGAQGFALVASDFGPAPASTATQLVAAGKVFYNLKQKVTPLSSFSAGSAGFNILVAALDTTNNGVENYDTLVFFDQAVGIAPGPFTLPATGPAYVRASDERSGLFYLEGSTTKAGLAFYVSRLDANLSSVHIARYSANFIPRNAAVLPDVDDINGNVGFWAPQPDFRIPERLSPGFVAFTELELEAIYEDQVRSFVDYQTKVALRAMDRIPGADVVMIYIEQPDGSGHQFLMTDPRQPSNFLDPNSIGANQDPAKRARYKAYLREAYRAANEAVHRIIEAAGIDGDGRPKSDVFVVSDHGFAPFHTAVNMAAFLASRGFDATKVRAITSGPAVNVYIHLEGREPGGTVSRDEYLVLQEQLVEAMRELRDNNPNYSGRAGARVFDQVHARPTPKKNAEQNDFGLGTDKTIGQDSGDVYATLSLGYNFDGTQTPVVVRLGDDPATPPAVRIFSLPNFYGAHGYDPQLEEMSAIFFAAGPNVCETELHEVRNIDIAPTVLSILAVEPAKAVQGKALKLCPPGRRENGN